MNGIVRKDRQKKIGKERLNIMTCGVDNKGQLIRHLIKRDMIITMIGAENRAP